MTISGFAGKRREFICALLLRLTICAAACNGGSGADAEHPVLPAPILIRQGQAGELLQLQQPLPGLTLITVQDRELPGELETTGQVTFDDRRVANIIRASPAGSNRSTSHNGTMCAARSRFSRSIAPTS